jgi:transglutaminase-like putative cysteine protease
MLIRIGYDLIYQFPQPTPLILTLQVHSSREGDLVSGDHLVTEPAVPTRIYRDGFGNSCTRLLAPAGTLRVTADAIISDCGHPEPAVPDAREVPVNDLPDDTLVYLLPSRYCESDLLSDFAWQTFGSVPPGWQRVQAVCDWVHRHIEFGYAYARPTKTAWEAFNERKGVCRDYAHLAIALLRALSIPARYCTTYLGDIGVPPVDAPMDFAGCLEAYVGDAWHSFDPRNNQRRIGRVLIARGRDAADAAISTSYGPHVLQSFKVWTDELPGQRVAA